MVESVWFFSTLAQSTAAIAGFLIAFSAVLYQVERQRRERRTERLREELVDFREKYLTIISLMADTFAEIIGEDELEDYIEIIQDEPEDLKEMIEADSDIEYPQSVLIWVNLRRVILLLDEIEASSELELHYLLSPGQFETLRETTDWLTDQFRDRELDKLFSELALEFEDRIAHPQYADVFGMETPWAKEGNPRETAIIEDAYTEEIKGWLDERFPDSDYPFRTGKNLYSFRVILGFLLHDFDEIDAHRRNTILDYDSPWIGKVVKVSGSLIFVGVFLPLLALFTFPQLLSGITITGWPLLIFQALLLILSGGITGYLLWLVMENISPVS